MPTPQLGLCQCGCGRETPIAIRSDSRRGAIKGRPRDYCLGHGNGKPLPPETSRICSGPCGLKKPITEFELTGSRRGGRLSMCKECVKERMRDRARQRRAGDLEASREQERIRRAARTPEQRAAQAAYDKAWQENNRERYRANMRRAKLLRKVGKNKTSRDYAEILLRDPCSYCGQISDSIDHIDPVSRGGDNLFTNLTGACLSCNQTKSSRTLLYFLAVR